MSGVTELTFEVNDLTLAAQRWTNCADSTVIGEEPAKCKHNIIALHGWLDNSASFAKVAPLLHGCDIVALDMAGHGYSSHRSMHGSYNIWDDLEDIVAVADALGWETFSLLGHSRGAFVSVLSAAVYPARVQRLVLLDGLIPMPQTVDFIPQLKRYLTSRRRLRGRKAGRFKSVDEAIERRAVSTGADATDISDIVKRDLVGWADGFCWRHDHRLHGASAYKMSQRDLTSLINHVEAPLNLVIASAGLFKAGDLLGQLPSNYHERGWNIVEHEGGHHFHAEVRNAPGVAKLILQYFLK